MLKDDDIRAELEEEKARGMLLVEYYKHFNPVRATQGKTEQSHKMTYTRLTEKGTTPLTKISGSKILRAEQCGTFIEMITDEGLQKNKVINANHCHDKYCSKCQKIKSTKTAYSFETMYNYIKDNNDYKFILLTLTAPNVHGENLKEELKEYSEALKRLFNDRTVKKMNFGYIAKLEITYNSVKKTFHPHYHILLAVEKNYFTNKNIYISHKKWLELWRRVKRQPRIKNVDIRKVKNKNDKGLSSEILELAKYVAKSNDYLLNKEVFEIYYNHTYKMRFFKYGGVFKEALKKFKAGELTKYTEIDETRYVYLIRYLYQYKTNKYKLDNYKELTEEDIIKIAMNEIRNLHLDFKDDE